MPTLLLRLAGPMQSWGTDSRFDRRDTGLEPSKSGVLGLVAAALGRDRAEPIDDLAALRLGVREDRPGVPRVDFQTAQNVVAADQSKVHPTTVSRRAYLADAVFLAGLEGEDEALLARIHAALRDPVWPLSLGRKSYVPSPGPYLDDGLCQQPLEEALKGYRWLGASGRGGTRAERPTYRMVLERPDAAEGAMRMDQPLGPFAERRFGARFVVTRTWRVPDDVPEPVDA